MLQHIFYFSIILIVISYLCFTAYLKYKLKFWLTQPVFHMYNLWYWIKPPGIINTDLPSVQAITQNGAGKYLNQFHIKTLEFESIKEDNVMCERICNFIKSYYIYGSKTANYTPTKENILDYHIGTNHPSFFTIYEKPKILFEKGEPISSINDIIAVIAAKAVNITLKNKRTFPTYYIDNLCVHPQNRKDGIAPQMIQTQCYNLRQENKKIQTCLFKREGQLNALVPLVVYDTFCFDLTDLFAIYKKEVSFENVTEISVRQLPLFTDFIKLKTPYFECVVMPDITNLMNLIKTENIIIYALLDTNKQILATYVYRNLNLNYDGKKVMECISIVLHESILQEKEKEEAKKVYELSFNIALLKLKKKFPFDLLLIENTANANLIIDCFNNNNNNNKTILKFKSPTAFFFYNYAHHTIHKSSLAMMVY
jgi:hypothetical protein